MIKVEYLCRIESVANLREHWAKKANRVKLHRQLAWAALSRFMHLPDSVRDKIAVTLTRIAPRTLDSDNLASGFKATRDQVADFLKLDDGDPKITWRYEQEKGKEYKVRVEIEAQEKG